MRTKLLLPLCFSVFSFLLPAFGQGTAFTYQGRLTVGTNVANGIYDVRFRLFDDPSAGAQIGPSRTNLALAVSNGFFAVTLDFTNGAFPGADRWLDIAVRSNTVATFSALTPRQKITPTPYAITAENVIGAVSATALAGTYSNAVTFINAGNSFTGDGGGLTALNASQLTSGSVPSGALSNAWKTTGNAGANPTNGAFLGTTDNLPLEIKVNGTRAFRIEPNVSSGASSLIGGSPANFADAGVVGAFIGGGGSTIFSYTNRTASSWSVIGGGIDNAIEAGASYSIIGGGRENTIQDGAYAAVVSGNLNKMTNADGSFIGAGTGNNIDGGNNTIGGGLFNRIAAQNYGFIGGGVLNQLGSTNVAGSSSGEVTNSRNAIAGGLLNWITAGAAYSFIGGGRSNRINGVRYATVPGGQNNLADGDHTFAAGFRAKALHNGAFVWADSQNADFASSDTNQFLIRASGGVGINVTNPVDALHVQADDSVRTRTATTGTGYAGFVSENSLGEWFAGLAPNTNYWELFENAPLAGARLIVKSGGNVGIGTLNPTNKLHVAGGVSATAFVSTSDRNAKENFAPVSPQDVLNKVAALPITTWNFKDMKDGRHMGPIAQDFYAAFGLGGSDTTITSVDPDGVALAAIQGLNQKLLQKETEIAELKQRLASLERLVVNLTSKGN